MSKLDELMALVKELERCVYEDGLAPMQTMDTKEARRTLQDALKAVVDDATCFQFWVSEAARSPGAMAALIANCTTEDDYRRAILPAVWDAKGAIDAARKPA